jgi:hypothetical protein
MLRVPLPDLKLALAIDKEIELEKRETERLERLTSSQTQALESLKLQKEAQILLYTDWRRVVKAMEGIFAGHANDAGQMEIGKAVKELKRHSKLACVAALPAFKRVSPYRQSSLAGFLAKIRPKVQQGSAQLRRLESALDDVERLISNAEKDALALRKKFAATKSRLRAESSALRRENEFHDKEIKAISAKQKAAQVATKRLTDRIKILEDENLAIGTPSKAKAAQIKRTCEKLTKEVEKLEVSLAAMLAVKAELSTRVAAKTREFQKASEAVREEKRRKEAKSREMEAELRKQNAEIQSLRTSLGLPPDETETLEPDPSLESQENRVEAKRKQQNQPLGKIGSRLENARRLVDARMAISMRNLASAETRMLAGLRESQATLTEIMKSVQAHAEVLRLNAADAKQQQQK